MPHPPPKQNMSGFTHSPGEKHGRKKSFYHFGAPFCSNGVSLRFAPLSGVVQGKFIEVREVLRGEVMACHWVAQGAPKGFNGVSFSGVGGSHVVQWRHVSTGRRPLCAVTFFYCEDTPQKMQGRRSHKPARGSGERLTCWRWSFLTQKNRSACGTVWGRTSRPLPS